MSESQDQAAKVDLGMTVDRTAEAVLVVHQRRDHRGCLCGWSELGRSHPGHQVAMLREAGLLGDAAPMDDVVAQVLGQLR